MLSKDAIKELVRIKPSGKLYHRESQELEFKEQFNLAGLENYLKDFAAFANNKGGFLIFGVKDSPRIPIGLSDKSYEQFDKIDPEKISGFLLEIFSGNITWEHEVYDIEGVKYAAFYIYPAKNTPIIAKKDEGKEQAIKNGEIYFRYGGRTQKIQFPELEAMIDKRVKANNTQWLDLMNKIGKIGPQNSAVLDLENTEITKENKKIFVIDSDLSEKLKFIKEGEFDEVDGEKTLKLIGDVVPASTIEVTRKIKENLVRQYPYSAMELAQEVKKICPECKQGLVWKIISDNDLKGNPDYSAYNFRNKKQSDHYKEKGELPKVTPCIYNQAAINIIVEEFRKQTSHD